MYDIGNPLEVIELTPQRKFFGIKEVIYNIQIHVQIVHALTNWTRANSASIGDKFKSSPI